MTRPLHARIDLAALRHNLQRARSAAPASRVMAVVKANAYGHGLTRVAQALIGEGARDADQRGVDAFGVACLEEAVTLREAGIKLPITLLEGFFDREELASLSHYRLRPVIHNEQQLAQLEAARLPQPIAIWLKLDTGMHRLGFAPERAQELYARLQASANVAEIGLFSHLGYADDRRSVQTQRQLQRFIEAIEGLQGPRSLANSGGVLAWSDTHMDWVRPGLMLYGISPFSGDTSIEQNLKPVMTLQSRLIAANRYERGAAIGYGGAWVCPEDMRVGVIAAGYGDGYPRHAPSGAPVLINGKRAQIIGRVSMDMLCVDLREHPDAQIGDSVVLWGEGLPAEEIARCAGTIPYELVCAVASRVPIQVIETEPAEVLS